MGQEEEKPARLKAFAGYQVDTKVCNGIYFMNHTFSFVIQHPLFN